ncbi:MAG: Vitamin B12 import ATP-binding protein BtuD [Phycisphaerae bacterium]|nr:Vitamin B12 import ATP-binding protein BtuD [Phycisphaerae bacterium]
MEVELQEVSKSFGRGADQKRAVEQVSWRAAGGQVFGLLGPNGAGKTTLIRMLLDIIRPDTGRIIIDGHVGFNRTPEFKFRIGYLPEERGLYRKRKVLEVLLYLAALKGFSRQQALPRAQGLLERFDLSAWGHKKVEDLSKGMGQKVQIASCLLHEPEMVVLDEPFSGLDPVNVRLVRELILEQKQRGRLVFLSTHLMAEVEALCDNIFMIHQGRQVLYGNLLEIKKRYTQHHVLVNSQAEPEGLPAVESVHPTLQGKYIRLREGYTLHDLMAQMAAARRPVLRIEEATTPIEDIFVQLVREAQP